MLNEIEKLVEKTFPFEGFNPGQKEAIVQAVTLLKSGVKHVIMEAPTGSGKSAIATTVHRVLKELDPSFRTTIITGTKGLQDQYVASESDIYDLKGKTNYDCPHGVGPYNSASCRKFVSNSGCSKKIECPYVMRREHWCKEAGLRLTNTSFQIEACPSLIMFPENKANLIVIDECHDLPTHLVNHCTLKLTRQNFFYTNKLYNKFLPFLTDVINRYVNYSVGSAIKTTKKQLECIKLLDNMVSSQIETVEAQLYAGKKDNSEILGGALEELQQVSDKLKMFISLNDSEWILTEFVKDFQVELKPVYAFQVSQHGIFRKSDQFLHISATICGFDAYRKSLGIKENEYKTIKISNHIPKENRKIKIISNVKVSGDFDRGLLVKNIDKIIQIHKQENGIIHSVSFKLAEEIKDYSKNSNRMVITNKREEILDLLNQHNSGKIIVSPSMTNGYDFKGDMCRWQVLAKIPFLYMGDPFVALNMQRSSEWYSREAILKMVQSCGRAVRGLNDYAITYILDGHVNNLIKFNKELIPDWWLESIID